MSHNVLFYPEPTDGFVFSIADSILEYAAQSSSSNADAPGASRHRGACKQLASYIRGLPLSDVRFQQLLRVSVDSDRFELVGKGKEFVQRLGLERPFEGDGNEAFNQFTVACGFRPAPAPGESGGSRSSNSR